MTEKTAKETAWDGPFNWRRGCPECGQPQGHHEPMDGYETCPVCQRPTWRSTPAAAERDSYAGPADEDRVLRAIGEKPYRL